MGSEQGCGGKIFGLDILNEDGIIFISRIGNLFIYVHYFKDHFKYIQTYSPFRFSHTPHCTALDNKELKLDVFELRKECRIDDLAQHD